MKPERLLRSLIQAIFKYDGGGDTQFVEETTQQHVVDEERSADISDVKKLHIGKNNLLPDVKMLHTDQRCIIP